MEGKEINIYVVYQYARWYLWSVLNTWILLDFAAVEQKEEKNLLLFSSTSPLFTNTKYIGIYFIKASSQIATKVENYYLGIYSAISRMRVTLNKHWNCESSAQTPRVMNALRRRTYYSKRNKWGCAWGRVSTKRFPK